MTLNVERDETKAPRKISRITQEITANIVRRCFVLKDPPAAEGLEGTYFEPDGTFKLALKQSDSEPEVFKVGFCSALVGEDPQEFKLQTTPRGAIRVLDRPMHRLVNFLEPRDLRWVEPVLTGDYRVSQSDILVPEDGRINVGETALTADEYLKFLKEAKMGLRPPIFWSVPAIKITDKELRGRRVKLKELSGEGVDVAVVFMDPEIGKMRLVSRELDYSLHRNNWEVEGRRRAVLG